MQVYRIRIRIRILTGLFELNDDVLNYHQYKALKKSRVDLLVTGFQYLVQYYNSCTLGASQVPYVEIVITGVIMIVFETSLHHLNIPVH